jgi:hypothetical protein
MAQLQILEPRELLTTVTVQATTSTAYEQTLTPGVDTVSVTGTLTQPLTVQYHVSGTAIQGTNIQSLPGSITLQPGQTSAPIYVTPINNGQTGANLTCVLTLSSASGYTVGNPSSATVNEVLDQANATLALADGSTNLSSGGSDSWGTTTVGTPVTKTLTVKDTGTGTLSVVSLTATGGFTVSTSGPLTINAGASTTFTVTMPAGSAGSPSGTLTLQSNDAHSPFTLGLSGTVNPAPAPQISVLDGTTSIANGGSDAFGTTPLGTALQKTITIKNTGNATLTLGTATAPSGFSVVTQPATSVGAGASTSLVLQLNGSTTGTYSGAVSFTDNVSGASPFSFSVSGQVVAPAISVADGSNSIANGGSDAFGSTPLGTAVQRTLTITDAGTATLTLGTVSAPSGFSIVTQPAGSVAPGGPTSVVVSMTATTAGSYSGALSFTDNVAGQSPFSITLTGQVTAPSMTVSDGSTTLANGASDSFGSTPLGTPIQKTFTISNAAGTAALTVSNVSLPGGFSLITAPAASIPAGGSTSMTVELNATTAGTVSGTLSFVNNMAGQSPFALTISGQTTSPALAVLDGSTTLANGSSDSFGTTLLGVAVDKTFTISNASGTSTLTIGSVSVPSGFSVITQPAGSIAAGGSTTFVVALTAAAVGAASGAMSFTDNSPGLSPFSVTISGQTTAPVAAVLDGTSAVANGGSDAFGSTFVGISQSKTFTIENQGTASLTVGTVQVPSGFTLASAPAASVPVGGATTFSVQFPAGSAGSWSGTVQFATSDGNNNPYVFTVSATAITPVASIDDVALVDDDGASSTDKITSDPRVSGVGNGNFATLGGVLDAQFQYSTDGGNTFQSDGTIALGAAGSSFTFDPRTFASSLISYAGPLVLEYRPLEYDSHGNLALTGAWSSFSLTLVSPNAPQAYDDAYSTSHTQTLTVSAAQGVTANDINNDPSPLTVVLVSGVTNGTLTLNSDGSFLYTSNPEPRLFGRRYVHLSTARRQRREQRGHRVDHGDQRRPGGRERLLRSHSRPALRLGLERVGQRQRRRRRPAHGCAGRRTLARHADPELRRHLRLRAQPRIPGRRFVHLRGPRPLYRGQRRHRQPRRLRPRLGGPQRRLQCYP